jgi:hypothetical protein
LLANRPSVFSGLLNRDYLHAKREDPFKPDLPPRAELGAFLRRGGSEAVLSEWKAAALDALGPQKKSTSDTRRVRELEKQLRRKDKALAEAAALLMLQKKSAPCWGNSTTTRDRRAKSEERRAKSEERSSSSSTKP